MKAAPICATAFAILCSYKVFSQDIAQTAVDDIHMCSASAASQELKGDARKNFMVKCLTDRAAARGVGRKSPAQDAIDRCVHAKSTCVSEAGEEYGKTLSMPTKTEKSGARISAAKAAIKDILNDPASAQFKDMIYMAQSGAVCGRFNGKNSMGGYVPFQLFAYSANGTFIVVEDASRVYGEASIEKLNKLGAIVFNSAAANILCATPSQG